MIDEADWPLMADYKWCAQGRVGIIYAVARIRGAAHNIVMHRLIMGAAPDQLVDHRDCDGLNNRRSNLRFCTRRTNAANAAVRRDNTSGYKGVARNGASGWQAYIQSDRGHQYLGSYATARKAAEAYDAAAREYFGEFARVNLR